MIDEEVAMFNSFTVIEDDATKTPVAGLVVPTPNVTTVRFVVDAVTAEKRVVVALVAVRLVMKLLVKVKPVPLIFVVEANVEKKLVVEARVAANNVEVPLVLVRFVIKEVPKKLLVAENAEVEALVVTNKLARVAPVLAERLVVLAFPMKPLVNDNPEPERFVVVALVKSRRVPEILVVLANVENIVVSHAVIAPRFVVEAFDMVVVASVVVAWKIFKPVHVLFNGSRFVLLNPREDVATGAYVPLASPTRTCPIVGLVDVPVPPLTGIVVAP